MQAMDGYNGKRMKLLPRPVRVQILILLSVAALLGGCSGKDVEHTENSESAGDASSSVRFSEHLIMDGYAYPYGIWASDLDGDGDLDLTSADYTPNNDLYWFENDGSGEFNHHFIQKDDPERLERHMVGDINHDNRPDVVIVKNLYGHLLWFQNPGETKIHDLWRRHVITTELAGAYSVALSDLDADGDLDVAASSWRMGNQFAWFENPGTVCWPPDGRTQRCYEEGREWTKHLIEANISETRCIRIADVDGDGDEDLLGTAPGAGLVLWYENSGNPKSEPWGRHVIDSPFRPMHGDPIDLDGDGDPDFVLALGMGQSPARKPGGQVVWYENDTSSGKGAWTRHLILESLPSAFEAVAGDLDGDGDVDVAATAWGDSGQVVWLENPGDPRGRWSHHPLKTSWPMANMLLLADLDGDQDLDVAAVAEHGSYEFRWWRNEGSSPAKSD